MMDNYPQDAAGQRIEYLDQVMVRRKGVKRPIRHVVVAFDELKTEVWFKRTELEHGGQGWYEYKLALEPHDADPWCDKLSEEPIIIDAMRTVKVPSIPTKYHYR